MKNVVIANYLRSPFTPAAKGELAKVRPDEMAGQLIKALVDRTGVTPDAYEDLILGCAFPEGEQGLNMARIVGFISELPVGVAGVTVNRFCGSSMQAIHMAAGAISMGAGDAFICGGVESMSRVPMTGFKPLPHPGLYESYPAAYVSMGQTAENVAKLHQITREDQDAFALASHRKAAKADEDGSLAAEIVAIRRNGEIVEKDGCIRPETSLEALADLKPAFDKDGTVTAGTSAPLTDGASAVVVCSEDFARDKGLDILARIKAISVAGCKPEVMGLGPVVASKKALERAGLSLDEVGVIELNEAFAAQALACVRELGIVTDRLNLDGGALALGHPLGASGARITGKAAMLLKRNGGKYALATMCIGGGQGVATVLETV